MEPIFPKLLEAFQQDHVMLGRGFNELSCCLRAGDPAGACAAARRLYEEAGAHIGFEEEDFYPVRFHSWAKRWCGGCTKSTAAALMSSTRSSAGARLCRYTTI